MSSYSSCSAGVIGSGMLLLNADSGELLEREAQWLLTEAIEPPRGRGKGVVVRRPGALFTSVMCRELSVQTGCSPRCASESG